LRMLISYNLHTVIKLFVITVSYFCRILLDGKYYTT